MLEQLKTTAKKIIWYFKKPNLPKTDIINVHLGCGLIDYPGFINVDAMPARHIHYLAKINKLNFFKANSANLIYASHCLEHISYIELDVVLKEWYRVLKPNGVIRLSVPNFDTIVNIYNDNNQDINKIIGVLYGEQNYLYNYHYSMFTEKSLSSLLTGVGFKNVQTWEHGNEKYKDLPDWSGRKLEVSGKHYEISLNLEAYK